MWVFLFAFFAFSLCLGFDKSRVHAPPQLILPLLMFLGGGVKFFGLSHLLLLVLSVGIS